MDTPPSLTKKKILLSTHEEDQWYLEDFLIPTESDMYFPGNTELNNTNLPATDLDISLNNGSNPLEASQTCKENVPEPQETAHVNQNQNQNWTNNPNSNPDNVETFDSLNQPPGDSRVQMIMSMMMQMQREDREERERKEKLDREERERERQFQKEREVRAEREREEIRDFQKEREVRAEREREEIRDFELNRLREMSQQYLQQNCQPGATLTLEMSDLPTFDGSIPENIFPFLQRFENILRIMKWTEPESLAWLESCVTENVVCCLPTRLIHLTTYKEAKELLKKTYLTDMVVYKNLQTLMNVQQEEGETLNDFYCRVQDISNVVFCRGIDDLNMTTHAFCRGLIDIRIRQQTLRTKPATLLDAFNVAKEEAVVLEDCYAAWGEENYWNQENYRMVPGVGTSCPTTGWGRN